MIEFHRHFERFAASLVRCLSEASYARKASGSATGQNAVNGIRFSDPIDIYIFIYTQYTTFSKLKFKMSHPYHNKYIPISSPYPQQMFLSD